jgi:hypothetical protein
LLRAPHRLGVHGGRGDRWVGAVAGMPSRHAPIGVTPRPAACRASVIALVGSMTDAHGRLERPLGRLLRGGAIGDNGAPSGCYRPACRAVRLGGRELDPSPARFAYSGCSRRGDFDIAAPRASFRAFAPSPPGGVLIMGYYVRTPGRYVAAPGRICGIERWMIGPFVAFGLNPSLTVLAVLAHDTVSYRPSRSQA